jgi:preprotein translocase subunit SecG
MVFLDVAQILVSIALVIVILLQVRGGGLGGIFGQPDTVYRTRRGIEKGLFQLTIVLILIFIALALVQVKVGA